EPCQTCALRNVEEAVGAEAIHGGDDVGVRGLRRDRKMRDDVDTCERALVGPRRQVEEVPVVERYIRWTRPGAPAERRHVVARFERARREMPADETRDAGDRDPHAGSPSQSVSLTTRRPVGRYRWSHTAATTRSRYQPDEIAE